MAQSRNKLLIVDGYNVLRSGNRYKEIAGPDYTHDAFNAAREALINDVVEFTGWEWQAVIVFDGARNTESSGDAQLIGGVRIMFSPAGQSADKVIEKLAHDAGGKSIETLVVTSDATIQNTVFGGGVDRMSANDFCWEIDALHAEGKLDRTSQTAEKNTLLNRLDNETRKKLENLRDNQ